MSLRYFIHFLILYKQAYAMATDLKTALGRDTEGSVIRNLFVAWSFAYQTIHNSIEEVGSSIENYMLSVTIWQMKDHSMQLLCTRDHCSLFSWAS